MWKFSQLSAKNFLENITQNKELKCLLFASTAFYVIPSKTYVKKATLSSRKRLEEVLEKYGIKSSSITSIPQFTPVPHPIDEKSPEFKLCIDDILLRAK
ncbi:unnamed protein product [Rhizophagus irregularis]|nr:unnamed protein product [Rhizophagus irregularis]